MDDRAAIIDTVNRYATALDSRDWPLLDRVFTPDAVGDFGGGAVEGREAIRSLVRRALGDAGPTQHLLGNHRLEIDSDSARCVCQVRAFHADPAGSAEVYELLGEYRDRLVRTSDGWRIAHRELAVNHEIGSRALLGL